jgi:hypothetical protein
LPHETNPNVYAFATRAVRTNYLKFDFAALATLALPSVPPNLAQEAVDRAAAGEHITKTQAEEMGPVAHIKRQWL